MKKRKALKSRRVLTSKKKVTRKPAKSVKTKPLKKTKKFLKKVKPLPAPPVAVVKKTRKPRRPKTPSDKMYFTPETERYIIMYNAETDLQKRNEIYNNHIAYAFNKLVENIFNTFKFSYFETSPLDVQKECVSHLVANIHKFEADKGKAFGYFSVVAKHYLIALNNSTYKRRNQHVEIGEEHDEHTVQLQSEDKHHKQAEMKEFLRLMILFWENNVGKIFNKQRDLDIANAVIELFRNSGRLEAFNKKALYLMIREIGNCRTQQITKVINKMKQYQTNIYVSYRDKGSVDVNNYFHSIKSKV
jgi:hypothetical protein